MSQRPPCILRPFGRRIRGTTKAIDGSLTVNAGHISPTSPESGVRRPGTGRPPFASRPITIPRLPSGSSSVAPTRPATATWPSPRYSWPPWTASPRRSTPANRWTATFTRCPPPTWPTSPSTPATLDEALEALERDHAFLTTGQVFTDDLIQTWIQYKRDNEVTPLRLRPHPYEFFLYYDS